MRKKLLIVMLRGMQALVLVGALGLVSGILWACMSSHSDPTPVRIAAARADIKSLRCMLNVFEVDTGAYPTTEEGLAALMTRPVGDAQTKSWKGPYLDSRELPKDPWGNDYVYRSISAERYDLSSPGPDGKIGTEDDIKD